MLIFYYWIWNTLHVLCSVFCPETPSQQLYEVMTLHHKHTVLFCVTVDLSGVRVRGHWVGLVPSAP